MKIATTIGEMYSYSTSAAEAIKQYEGSGFRYLDCDLSIVESKHPFATDNWKDVIFECKETADKLGFSFVQAHAASYPNHRANFEEGITGLTRAIEACGILGIQNMVVHSAVYADIKYPDDQLLYFKENEPFFRTLIPAMEKNNVRVLFENTTRKHLYDGAYFPIYGRDLNAFVAFMDHPLFGAVWDVGHAHMDGIDHYTEIMEMGKNLKAIHVHDNTGSYDQHTAPFLGTLDYDSLMRGLIESGYDGYFTLESGAFFRRRRSKELQGPLAQTPLAVKKQALSLLYTICKEILSAYNVFEE